MSDRIGQKLAREKRVADAARAFPKGPTRKAIKAKKGRSEAKVKKSVRQQVYERDGECRIFYFKGGSDQGALPLRVACDGRGEWAHFDAFKRARTRGQAPTKRHTTGGSLMLCTVHHVAYDRGDLTIRALTPYGCDGPLEFTC
jgi:hypothetical protein